MHFSIQNTKRAYTIVKKNPFILCVFPPFWLRFSGCDAGLGRGTWHLELGASSWAGYNHSLQQHCLIRRRAEGPGHLGWMLMLAKLS